MPRRESDKKGVSKQKFDINEFKKNKGLGGKTKEKDLTWVPLSPAFSEALNIPGVPRGYTSLFRGFSDTGKSTAIYEAIRGCQRSNTNDLPVIIDTESNFSWQHAKNIGVEFEEVADESTGEIIDYEGDFIYVTGEDLLRMYQYFHYKEGKDKQKPQRSIPVVEDVARFIGDLLDSQEEGELPRNLCFLWDSIGSMDCFDSAINKTSNNMWNAQALEREFKSLLNHRIPSSRKDDKEYTNTLCAVQKIWIDNTSAPQPIVKHKGGEGFYYGARLIVHMGGVVSHGVQTLKATTKGRNYHFGVETKIKCDKNQVNGVTLEGKIASTPHGFVNPDKINDYKENYKEHILEQMNLDSGQGSDIGIEKEEKEFSAEDLKE